VRQKTSLTEFDALGLVRCSNIREMHIRENDISALKSAVQTYQSKKPLEILVGKGSTKNEVGLANQPSRYSS
jgi:hypothetical protein